MEFPPVHVWPGFGTPGGDGSSSPACIWAPIFGYRPRRRFQQGLLGNHLPLWHLHRHGQTHHHLQLGAIDAALPAPQPVEMTSSIKYEPACATYPIIYILYTLYIMYHI